VIAALLKASPAKSNRQVAEQAKADHKTVGAVRQELESTGEIPQLERTKGKDGKKRPASRRTRKARRPGKDRIIDRAEQALKEMKSRRENGEEAAYEPREVLPLPGCRRVNRKRNVQRRARTARSKS
jgi:hypothetical protein